MKIHNFFTTSQLRTGEECVLEDDNLNHQLRSVLRLKQGSTICLYNNTEMEYIVEIIGIDKKRVTVKVQCESPNTFSKFIKSKGVRLAVAGLKKDKLELVVQKATELGVESLDFILTDRTEKPVINFERIQRIALEASEQSGRSILPRISSSVENLTEYCIRSGISNLLYADCVLEISSCEHIRDSKLTGACVLVGPEGGWTNREREFFSEKSIKAVTFGPQILRAETAAIAAVAILISS